MAFKSPRQTPDGFYYVGHGQIFTGNYEPEIRALLYKVGDKFSTFVNVGANHGYYLCLAARLGFLNVLGVEPLIQNLKVLRRNLRLNGFDAVQVVQGACGRPNDSSIVLFGSGSGASTQRGWGGAKSKIKRRVKVFSLDSLVDLDSEPCMFVVDVEGYESKVLDGSASLLKRKSDIWLVEISFNENTPDGSMNPDAIVVFQKFTEEGFGVYAWAPTLSEIKVNDAKDLERFSSIFHMFLFVKNLIVNEALLERLNAENKDYFFPSPKNPIRNPQSGMSDTN
jgi:FkbM family methyltransferase